MRLSMLVIWEHYKSNCYICVQLFLDFAMTRFFYGTACQKVYSIPRDTTSRSQPVDCHLKNLASPKLSKGCQRDGQRQKAHHQGVLAKFQHEDDNRRH
jgi:hypothetical protein